MIFIMYFLFILLTNNTKFNTAKLMLKVYDIFKTSCLFL